MEQQQVKRPLVAPTNTLQEAREVPILMVGEAMAHGGVGQAIEAQEAQGQSQLVHSDTLPTKMDDKAKAALEAAGAKFLGPVEGDRLFQYVELPAGWTKQATGHSMWSYVVDDQGRIRASIFYKAAFYDRDAFLRINLRYRAQLDYTREDKDRVAVANVLRGEEKVFTTEPLELPGERALEYFQIQEQATKQAIDWLTEHYPDWQNPTAYWD